MFVIGIILNSRFGVELSKIRVFGVLQRIAISYFFTAILELTTAQDQIQTTSENFKISNLFRPFKCFSIVLAISLTWIIFTFYLPVPGCQTGYLGPGGISEFSKFFNCTGGSAKYIDEIILGSNHLYQRPTSSHIYKSTEPFDPEGILGSLNSIALACLGSQAGRLIIFKDDRKKMISWSILGSIYFLLFAAITKFDLNESMIPVNKNLWTTSYILLTGASGFYLLVVFYYLIDVKKMWSGAPFVQLGQNSILIYICHVVFSNSFPAQWIASNTHLSQLFMDLWGSIFWTIVSIYLYKKKIFFSL